MQSIMPAIQQKFWGNNNLVLSGGKIYAYEHGTHITAPTYQNEGGAPNPQPIVLDALGEAQIWLDPAIVYDFEVFTSANVPQFTRENVSVASTGGSSSGDFIKKITPLNTKQYISTQLTSVVNENTGELDVRDGSVLSENSLITGNASGSVIVPGSAKVTVSGPKNASYAESVIVDNTSTKHVDKIVNGSVEGDLITKVTNTDITIYDSVHGEADRYARLSDVVPGITEVKHADTENLVLTGLGTTASPLRADLQGTPSFVSRGIVYWGGASIDAPATTMTINAGMVAYPAYVGSAQDVPLQLVYNKWLDTSIPAPVWGSSNFAQVYYDVGTATIKTQVGGLPNLMSALQYQLCIITTNDGVNITGITYNAKFIETATDMMRQLLNVVGQPKQGLKISGRANLGINVSDGGIFAMGSVFNGTYFGGSDTNSINLTSHNAITDGTLKVFMATQTDIIPPSTTVLDVANYDVGGVVTSMGATRWTNIRVYGTYESEGADNTNKLLVVAQYGQVNYGTRTAAIQAIDSESFVINSQCAKMTKLCTMTIQANETATSGATIANTDAWGGSAGGGAGAASGYIAVDGSSITTATIPFAAGISGTGSAFSTHTSSVYTKGKYLITYGNEGSQDIAIKDPSGTYDRWIFRKTGVESTGNTGSDLDLWARDDSGAAIGSVMRITRAAGGNIALSRPVVATSLAKSGGTSAQFLKADGTVDSNTYATTSALGNYVLKAGDTMSGLLSIIRSAASTDSFYTYVTGDARARFAIRADGQIAWSNGTAVIDTTLYRSAANTLTTGALTLTGALTGTTGAFSGDVTGQNWELSNNNLNTSTAAVELGINKNAKGGGVTTALDARIYDGKGAAIALFKGSDKSTTLYGALTGSSYVQGTDLRSYGTIGANDWTIYNGTPSGATQRWIWQKSGAESTGNAGSNLSLLARADDGTGISTVLILNRAANGSVDIYRPTTISQRLYLDGSDAGFVAPPSAGATPNGSLRIGASGQTALMLTGGIDSAALSGWIQARNNASATFYKLQLNPRGGVVEIGSGGASILGSTVGTDARFGSIAGSALTAGWTAPIYATGTTNTAIAVLTGDGTKNIRALFGVDSATGKVVHDYSYSTGATGYSWRNNGAEIASLSNLGALAISSIKIGTTATAGYVLTTDANGNGTWQAPGGGGSYVTKSGDNQITTPWSVNNGASWSSASAGFKLDNVGTYNAQIKGNVIVEQAGSDALTMYRPSFTNSDTVCQKFDLQNSTGTQTTYGMICSRIDNNASTGAYGSMYFKTLQNNVLTDIITLGQYATVIANELQVQSAMSATGSITSNNKIRALGANALLEYTGDATGGLPALHVYDKNTELSPRFGVSGLGKLGWSDGAAASDVALSRSAAGVLTLDGNLTANTVADTRYRLALNGTVVGQLQANTADTAVRLASNVTTHKLVLTTNGVDRLSLDGTTGVMTASTKFNCVAGSAASAGLNLGAFVAAVTSPVDGDLFKGAADVLNVRMGANTRTLGFLQSAQTWSAVQTFSSTPVISSTTAATTAGALYKRTNYGLVGYESGMAQEFLSCIHTGPASAALTNNAVETDMSAGAALFGTRTLSTTVCQIGTRITLKARISYTNTAANTLNLRCRFGTGGATVVGTVTLTRVNSSAEIFDVEFSGVATAAPSATSAMTWASNVSGNSVITKDAGTVWSSGSFTLATSTATALSLNAQWTSALPTSSVTVLSSEIVLD
jgi:hypothetical protein